MPDFPTATDRAIQARRRAALRLMGESERYEITSTILAKIQRGEAGSVAEAARAIGFSDEKVDRCIVEDPTFAEEVWEAHRDVERRSEGLAESCGDGQTVLLGVALPPRQSEEEQTDV